MSKIVRVGVVLLFGIAIVATLAACGSGASIKSAKRTLYMAAIEPKGSTTVDKEPFPAAPLPQGGGYIIKPPNKDGQWEISTYRWDTNSLIAYEGDEVTLEIVGINGKEHPSAIEGYNVNFNVLRGQVTKVNFKADKIGVFSIVCNAHTPTMTAQLVVLPR